MQLPQFTIKSLNNLGGNVPRSKYFNFDRVMTLNFRLENSLFNSVKQVPSFPGAWTAGPMEASVNHLEGRLNGWHERGPTMTRQYFRPLERLVLINAVLALDSA